MSMGCSSVCEKNKDESGGGKTQRNHFYTLDNIFPLDWKYLLSNMWRKPFERIRKTGLKALLKSWFKIMTKPPNI